MGAPLRAGHSALMQSGVARCRYPRSLLYSRSVRRSRTIARPLFLTIASSKRLLDPRRWQCPCWTPWPWTQIPKAPLFCGSVLDTDLKQALNDAAETAAVRDEARAQARIAAEKMTSLSAENDRLSTENDRVSTENARLRAEIDSDALRTRAETEMQMEALGAH
jgi:hypothetical protein